MDIYVGNLPYGVTGDDLRNVFTEHGEVADAKVISDKYSEVFKEYFRNEKMIASKSELSSLTISLPEENYKLAGIYYYIFRDLAWAGINILEVISTTNEFTLVVDDKNVEKAFRMIKWIGK